MIWELKLGCVADCVLLRNERRLEFEGRSRAPSEQCKYRMGKFSWKMAESVFGVIPQLGFFVLIFIKKGKHGKTRFLATRKHVQYCTCQSAFE